jgi:hypothetical protein
MALVTKKLFSHAALSLLLSLLVLTACAPIDRPDARTATVPPAVRAQERLKAINENYQPITRVPLGRDALIPRALMAERLPDLQVGPFELRGEPLASALQLVLDDVDISLALESERATTSMITISNLKGNLPDVVKKLCSLAALYCSFENNSLTIKDSETFVVDLPPIGDEAAMQKIADGLEEVLKIDTAATVAGATTTVAKPKIDATTRVMVYRANARTQRQAEKYFERLRKATALIIYETNVWEVTLNNENRTGINWSVLVEGIGNFSIDYNFPGGAPDGVGLPLTITPTYSGSNNISSEAVFEFISSQGSVKTISQPQLTVLSGSTATLDVQAARNFVKSITRTTDEETGDVTVSTATDTVNTGLRLNIKSAWDQATVYGDIEITLNELLEIEDFSPSEDNVIQLPRTTSRNLKTQVRVRPGDSILIAGLVSEKDEHRGSGPGLMRPIFDTSRRVATTNTELVFLLRPRVIAYVTDEDLIKQQEATQAAPQGQMTSMTAAPMTGQNMRQPAVEINSLFAPPESVESGQKNLDNPGLNLPLASEGGGNNMPAPIETETLPQVMPPPVTPPVKAEPIAPPTVLAPPITSSQAVPLLSSPPTARAVEQTQTPLRTTAPTITAPVPLVPPQANKDNVVTFPVDGTSNQDQKPAAYDDVMRRLGISP